MLVLMKDDPLLSDGSTTQEILSALTLITKQAESRNEQISQHNHNAMNFRCRCGTELV